MGFGGGVFSLISFGCYTEARYSVSRGEALINSGHICVGFVKGCWREGGCGGGVWEVRVWYSCQGCGGPQPTIARWLASMGTPRSA